MGQFSKISDFIGMKFVRIPLKKYLRFSFEIFQEENEGLFKLYMLFNFYSLYTWSKGSLLNKKFPDKFWPRLFK